MLNPFFLQGSKGEQNLIQDLINEQIRMYGVDIHYLPRQYATTKKVIREVIESKFTSAYPLEVYIENYDGYGESNVMLSKFGIQATNELTLTISKERFENYIGPLIQNIPDIKLSTRPREGDIIYFPLGKRLFEIKFVEHEQPFYQLQRTYVYTVKCELFRYEDEVIDTSIAEVDNTISGISTSSNISFSGSTITQSIKMIGIGQTASAITSLAYGGVTSITVTNRGGGYTTTPTIGISSAPPGGITAQAVPVMISGIVVCNENVNPASKSVQAINITNPGLGYTTTPSVKIIGDGSGATATATIGNGIVGIITVTNPGSGYTGSPTITFSGISSTPAQAFATLNSFGSITSIQIVNAGLGYTVTPTISFSSPSTVGFGTYIYNEIVRGSSSDVTARVRSWDGVNYVLEVSTIDGEFEFGETIVGEKSGATYQISTININNINDGYSDNDDIQIEADSIINFSESNPFGMP